MIYVNTGNLEYGFYRLVKKMDEIAYEIDEDVVIQAAGTKYSPRNANFFAYTGYAKAMEYFQHARLIVAHCSTGSIINAKRFGKPLIVVPRRKNYGEHVDDHQLELAKTIEGERSIIVVYDIGDLKEAVIGILNSNCQAKPIWEKPEGIIEAIRNFVDDVVVSEREESEAFYEDLHERYKIPVS